MVVVTLAVAIGINTTIFTIVNAVLLRPLPFAEPARLVTLWESNRAEGQERVDVSGLTFLDWRERAKSFAALGVWRYRGFTITDGVEAERVTSVEITPGGLDALGVPATLGRLFDEASGQPGGERQVLLSAGAWARRFGSDPHVVGRSLRLDDQTLRRGGGHAGELSVSTRGSLRRNVVAARLTPGALPSRPHRMYQAIGRLGPGVSIGQAQADMNAVADGIAREHPDSNAGWSVTLIPAHEQVVGKIGTTLWVLFGAVVLVLLIACANVASLLVARSTRTSKDFAVRAAFGASAFALARRSLVESALLALAGGSAGVALAWWAMGALRRIVPASVPRADQIGVDWIVLAFAAAVTAVAGMAFGLVPAWRAMRPSVLAVLQEGGRGAVGSRRSRRAANALVAGEVALALVLLVAAGLLAQSFARLVSVNPGFRTSGVTAVHVALPAARYGQSASKREFFDRLVAQLAATPGVQSAGAVSVLPMSPLGQDFDLSFTIDGLETTSPSERPRANYRGVIAGYFETMGIALREGRLFDSFDGRENGPRVAIVNETAVRRYFQNGSPINRLVKIPMAGDLKIVGVVADVKHYGLDAAPDVEVFVPYTQLALSEMQVVVRPGPGGGSVAPTRARGDRRDRSGRADGQGVADRRADGERGRATAIQHRAARRSGALRGVARGHRRLWRRDARGLATHGGNRLAHGAWRGRRRHVPPCGQRCGAGGRRGRRDRSGRRRAARPVAAESAVRCHAARSADLRRGGRGPVVRRRAGRERACSPRRTHRSGRSAASGITP